MSTEGISLNIVENSTSDKLTKGDLKKGMGETRDVGIPRQEKAKFNSTQSSCITS